MIEKNEVRFTLQVKKISPDLENLGNTYIEIEVEVCKFNTRIFVDYSNLNYCLSKGITYKEIDNYIAEVRKKIHAFYDTLQTLERTVYEN